MAFRRFSTAVADYLLLLKGHLRVTNQAEISAAVNDLDSVVLEHIELGGSALESARGMICRAVNAVNPNVQVESAQGSGPGVETARAPGQEPGPAERRLPSPRDQLGELGDLIERRAQRTGHAFACSIVDVNLTEVGLYGSYGVAVMAALAGAVLVARANRAVRAAQGQDRGLSRREVVRVGGLLLAGSWLLGDLIFSPLVALLRGQLREPWHSLLSWRMEMTPTPLVELRNAILARKVEEHLAPGLARQLGRRPRIGIFYGGRHITIESYLSARWKRDWLLGAWAALGFPGAVEVHLNRVLELRYTPTSAQGGEWALTESSCPAFRMQAHCR